MLVLTAVVSASLAYYFSPAKRSERAVAKLRETGADIIYDFQWEPASHGVWFNRKAEPPGPKLVRKVIGEGFFQNADRVFFDKPMSVSDFQLLAGLPSVLYLTVHNCELDDEHMKVLPGLHRLESFDGQANAISDIGVAHLAELQDLATLWLSQNRISGTGFKSFSTPSLVELHMYDNPITNEGLIEIGRLTSLEKLGIGRTTRAAGDGNKVTDDGIAHLADLKRLKFICLVNLDITDEALQTLQQIPSLQTIELYGTEITNAGVADLKAALPNCKIKH